MCAASLTVCTRFFDDNVNVNVIESVEQYELTYDGVLQQVRQNPRLRGIYMANESVRGCCMDALERAKPNRRIHVVCHDLTPHARQYLEDGRLDFIVDQDFFGADDARDRSAGAYTAYRRVAAAEHRIHSHQHYHKGIVVRKEPI